MNHLGWRLWLSIVAAAGMVCALPAAAWATPVDEIRLQAEQFEKESQWDRACELYEQILKSDRDFTEIKERYQYCLRRVHQVRRHREPTFRQKVLDLSIAQSLQIYGEVVAKIQAHYVDRDKVLPSQLFQQGVEEFCAALSEDAFRREYLPLTDADMIPPFQAMLRDTWGNQAVRDPREARARAREVAMIAQRDLRLKPSVTVLEFVCGACNALDEYTAFVASGLCTEEDAAVEGPAEKLRPNAMKAEILSDGIGYIQLAGFQKTTLPEIEEAFLRLRTEGMRVLVLDLRGNPGGLFRVAVRVAERFLPSGIIVSTQGQLRPYNKTHEAFSGMGAWDIPLVVLIDGDTASAAEVVAGALKENQRATLVGETTFGKGSMQCVLPVSTLPTGMGGIRITLARFYSPNGHAYSGGGITPHTAVARTAMSGTNDAQLQAALQEAARLLAMGP